MAVVNRADEFDPWELVETIAKVDSKLFELLQSFEFCISDYVAANEDIQELEKALHGKTVASLDVA